MLSTYVHAISSLSGSEASAVKLIVGLIEVRFAQGYVVSYSGATPRSIEHPGLCTFL